MTISTLIIDDYKGFHTICSKSLKKEYGFDVHFITSCYEAFPMVPKNSFDLILVDINLGKMEMDGITCVYELRSLGFEGPICMVTADSSLKTILRSALAGADDYWVKCSKGTIRNLRFEVENLMTQIIQTTAQSSTKYTPIRDGGLLRSLGLRPIEIDTSFEFLNRNFPREKDLAEYLRENQSTIAKRFSRMRDTLSLDSLPQISQLMTLVSMFADRRAIKRGDTDSEV